MRTSFSPKREAISLDKAAPIVWNERDATERGTVYNEKNHRKILSRTRRDKRKGDEQSSCTRGRLDEIFREQVGHDDQKLTLANGQTGINRLAHFFYETGQVSACATNFPSDPL